MPTTFAYGVVKTVNIVAKKIGNQFIVIYGQRDRDFLAVIGKRQVFSQKGIDKFPRRHDFCQKLDNLDLRLYVRRPQSFFHLWLHHDFSGFAAVKTTPHLHVRGIGHGGKVSTFLQTHVIFMPRTLCTF